MLLGLQLCLQPGNLTLELPQHGVLGVLIDARLVGDVLGPVGIAQRAQRLLVVVAGWAYVGNHDCLGIASQGVLHALFLNGLVAVLAERSVLSVCS